MGQTHDDEINQGDCPRKEGSGVRPVRHWKMPLLEPPERDKDGQEGEADEGAPKSDLLNCWTNCGSFSPRPNRQREGLENACR